jgi:hypothetical protein
MHRVFHFSTQQYDLRTTMKLRALVAGLHLQVHFLDQSIHDEEQRADIFDIEDVAYPTLARNLRARRDNLLVTIRVLETRMAEADHEGQIDRWQSSRSAGAVNLGG